MESDEKQKKVVARQMIKMLLDINKANFGAGQTVTCYSCHRGELVWLARCPCRRAISRGQGRTKRRPGYRPPTILKKYVAGIGGEHAWASFKTIVMKGTIERSRGRNADGSLITGHDAVEITLKGPDKYLVKLTTPQGVVMQCINGAVGWVSGNNGSRRLSAGDLERVRQAAVRYGIIKVTEAPERMKVIGTEVIGGREAYVAATSIDSTRDKKLFFDTETGLLLREITTTETMLAPLPEQVDFEDYGTSTASNCHSLFVPQTPPRLVPQGGIYGNQAECDS